MALIKCPECGTDVSEQAPSCPACGYPVAKGLRKKSKPINAEYSDEELQSAINSRKKEAEAYVKDPEKFERFLERLEKKLKNIPTIGEYVSEIACMLSLVNSYVNKEYTNIPLGTIIGIVSALVYVVSPWDLVPDIVPGAGLIDDAAVISFALHMVRSDLAEYKAWREGKEATCAE